jgi:osmotically-inducible protein OsmY
MPKQGRFILVVLFLACGLSSCISNVWTGASLLYDRHSLYEKFADYRLIAQINNVLAVNKTFAQNGCILDIGVFHGDILIAGHLPTDDLYQELRRRLRQLKGYRRLFNEVKLAKWENNSVQDSWITAKIRSRIFADDSIDPNAFKVITSDRVVYLMGDVKADEAAKVVQIARSTNGVEQVVKIMKYFTYQSPKK